MNINERPKVELETKELDIDSYVNFLELDSIDQRFRSDIVNFLCFSMSVPSD